MLELTYERIYSPPHRFDIRVGSMTYERIYSPPHRFDIRVGSMRVGELRILPYYGEKKFGRWVPGDCLVGASFPLHA